MLLLEELNTEFGNIRITRSKQTGFCTYYQGSCCHSQADTEGVSTCAYIHAMYSAIKQSGAHHILMVGCAGGSLATMLHRSGCDVTVVDINPHAFDLAKRYFHMPEGIECVVGDGWSYILENAHRYDAIALDAFQSDATIPESFTNGIFFYRVGQMLQDQGILVMNVLTDNDLDLQADQIALHMEGAGMPAILFDQPGRIDRNTIVVGGNKSLCIPSGQEPEWIRQELGRFMRRNPYKNTTKHIKS